MRKTKKIFLLLTALVLIIGAVIIITSGRQSLVTTNVSTLDWQASPFKVYVAQPGDGDWYKIIGIYSDGSGQEEVVTLGKAEWREQQEKYMAGYKHKDNSYTGTSLSPNGRVNIIYSVGFLRQKNFILREEGVEKTMIDGLVWPKTWLFVPEALYWMPDSRHILVEDKGKIFVIQASNGQYAELTDGFYPSLYGPQTDESN